jgi:hypothetical protein
MTDKTEQAVPRRQDHPFEVSSITRADAPEGAASANWYRYEIFQGANAIVGHREGSLQAVTQAVAEIVIRLNERRLGKAGRVHLTPGPKKNRGA